MIENYTIKFESACPESVFVRIYRNGTQAKAFQVSRKAAGSRDQEAMESVRSMMNRAETEAEKWVDEDRDARTMEVTLNTR